MWLDRARRSVERRRARIERAAVLCWVESRGLSLAWTVRLALAMLSEHGGGRVIMDDALEQLRRAAEEDPDDVTAVRRYEAALLRAGRREDVEGLYRFKFQCPMRWEDLTPDPLSSERRACDRCRRDVHFVRSREELATRVSFGQCVSFQASAVDALGVLVDDPQAHPAREADRPCVVELHGPPPGPEQQLTGAIRPLRPIDGRHHMGAMIAPPPRGLLRRLKDRLFG